MSQHQPVPRLLSVGTKCPRINLTLNGIQVAVQADTGSELDLIRTDFVESNEFRTHSLDSRDPHEIELFDGRRVPLLGKTLVKMVIHGNDLFSSGVASILSGTR